MIISDRRSIRSVPLENGTRNVNFQVKENPPVHKIKVTPPPVHRPKKSNDRRNSRRLWLAIIIAVVLLVAGTAFIASRAFSRATFTIVPVVVPINVGNMTIVATGTSTPGYIKYDVVKYGGTATTTLPAVDGPLISIKSSGTVTLYNYFAPTGQRLIAGTRFVNGAGLIYRLPNSVFIPGSKSIGNSVVPGTLKTVLVADNAGTQYDLSKGDGSVELRIIAYFGSPRYDTVYAKLHTDITGGFSGTKKTVDQTLLASTTKNLEDALIKTLRSQAATGVPSGYVTYDNAYTTSFAAPTIGGETAKTATVTVTGTLYSVIFKRWELITKLSGTANIDRFGNLAFGTTGLEALKFTITNPTTFRPVKTNTLIARLNGSMTLKGTVPEKELKHKLAGLSLADTRAIFASYSPIIDVSKSFGELFPSWASSVPKDENRISLIIKE